MLMKAVVLVTLTALSALSPVCVRSYQWPLSHFDDAHPITGTLSEFRTDHLHLGVDIGEGPGTNVYPVVSGTIVKKDQDYVTVGDGARNIRYLHITPKVDLGQTVTAGITVLGTIQDIDEDHLHFEEDGGAVNPLRLGGLTPYTDTSPPSVEWVKVVQQGTGVEFPLNEEGCPIVMDHADIKIKAKDAQSGGGSSTVAPYRIGYEIRRDDGTLIGGPYYKIQFDGIEDDWQLGLVYSTAESDLQNYVYWATNTPDTNQYWDTEFLQGGYYRIRAYVKDIKGNGNPSGVANSDVTSASEIRVYVEDDVAARLASEWAYGEGGDVLVGWHAEVEHNVAQYIVDGVSGSVRKGVGRLRSGDGPRPGVYSLRVPGGYTGYSIAAIDGGGIRCDLGYAELRSGPPTFLTNLLAGTNVDELEQVGESVIQESWCRHDSSDQMIQDLGDGVPDWVFYGPDSLLEECGPAADWLRAKGLDVELVAASAPDYLLLWNYLYALKVHADSLGVPYPRVIIVGDANQGGEPAKNQVSVAYFSDSTGACYFDDPTVCPSEDAAVDFNGDGLGDMQVARLPLRRRLKVAGAVQNFLAKVAAPEGSDRALFAVGDIARDGNSPAELPGLMADMMEQFGANGYATRYLKESTYGEEAQLEKQLAMADSLNEGIDILVNMGTVSNRSRIGGYFIQKVDYPEWDMNWLDSSGPRPFVFFGPGCDMADFDRNNNNPSYDPILAEMFLANDPMKPAAVAWISHGRGNWATWYRLFAAEFVDWLFSGETVDVLDCYWKTKWDCWVKYPEMRNFLRSMFYLGWPVSVRGTCSAGVDKAERLPVVAALAVYPNPARFGGTIRFGLPAKARVKVEVFDVRGRSVVAVVDKEYEGGRHSVNWAGRASSGEYVAPGVYFVRMTAGRDVVTAKLIMAR